MHPFIQCRNHANIRLYGSPILTTVNRDPIRASGWCVAGTACDRAPCATVAERPGAAVGWRIQSGWLHGLESRSQWASFNCNRVNGVIHDDSRINIDQPVGRIGEEGWALATTAAHFRTAAKHGDLELDLYTLESKTTHGDITRENY